MAVLVSAGLAAARARSDPRWRPAMTAVIPIGLAVFMTAALRLSFPAKSAYPLLSMVAAALVWFGVSRVSEPPWRAAGRDVRDGRRDSVRDGKSRYRSGDRPDDDYWPDDTYGPADDYVPDGQYATYGPRGGAPGPARPRGTGDIPGAGPAARSANGRDQVNGRDQGRRVNSGPQAPMPQWQDRYRGSGPGGPGADEAALAGAELGPQASTGGSAAVPPARPYGRILIFTLLDDRVADFDRLAEQAAEEVRIGEPDTLVYVIHLVPNAPMQRIFYEIYRDRAAFDSHEAQPYMQRFVAERRSCVLATNVIELRLKYAKVAPLPSPQASVPPPGGQLCRRRPRGRSCRPARRHGRSHRRPARPSAPGGFRGHRDRREPSGFSPCPRPGRSARTRSARTRSARPAAPDPRDPQRPDPRWPDQRPERQRPDQRQVPSADRYYRG